MSSVSILLMVLKRIVNNINLILASIAGLVITVTLVSSIPLYSEGMSEALLRRQLTSSTDQVQPKSSILLRHFEDASAAQGNSLASQGASSGASAAGGASGSGAAASGGTGTGTGGSGAAAPAPVSTGNVFKPITLDDYARANDYLTKEADRVIGIPRRLYVTYGQTDSLPLLTRTDDQSITGREFAGYGFLAYVRDFEKHAKILDGRLPQAKRDASGDIEAVMATAGLDENGLEVGDRVAIVWEKNGQLVPVNVKITGRWYPQNPEDTYWFYQLDYFNNAIIVPEESFFENVARPYEGITHEFAWFMIFDVNAIRSDNVPRVLDGIAELRSRTATILGNVRMEISPESLLQDYSVKLFFLKILLFVLSAPIICIVLYYITISAGMIIDRQRNEIAILKSRGASIGQVVGVYLTEGGLLGSLALIVGPILGMLVAQFIGRTYTFLVFSNRELLPVHVTAQTMQFALMAVGLSIGAMVLPAVGAARHSIVSYKQEASRSSRAPFWQRWFIDFLILGVSGYGYYMLSQRQSVLTLGEAGDVFSDPLLLLVPAIFIFSCSLVFLRFFPWLINALSWIGGRFFPVSVMLGLRQIGRMPGQYTRLVLLLTLTLALGTFAASVAKTLDRNYNDRVYYQTGSDLLLVESGQFDEVSETWSFQPVSDHLEVKSIKAAARVFRSTGNANITGRGRPQEVKIMAVDPPDFAQVTWWREDFADRHVNSLLNGLAGEEKGAIVDRKFLDEFKLKVGDSLVVNVKQRPVDFTITGVVSYWPTMWPDTERFFVVNLDYLFDQIGQSPYDVWARTDGVTPPQQTVNDVRERDFIVSRFVDARETALRLRDDPSRTGIFGILTVGFIISALLTVLGFMLYSFLSAKRRMQQLGILRAMGLSIRQLISLFLLFEQGFLIALGMAVGTILGVTTGFLFIPFLQIKSEAHAGIPKFVVMTAWDDIAKIYFMFGIILAVAIPAFIWMLARMKIHEAIKFGDETG
jgi:putative ABC transport system permease protein